MVSYKAKQTEIKLNSGASIEIDLLPCPLCGSEPEMIHKGNDHTKPQGLTVKCTNRSCRVERTDKVFGQSIFWLIAKSVESWNTRAEQEKV